MELTLQLVLTLAAVAAVAGFVDSIAGGGGLLTVPALLVAGLDPVTALATNKIQGSFGLATSSLQYLRHGAADWRAARLMMLIAFVVSALGAAFVTGLPVDHLKAWLPLVLILIAFYFLLSPRLGDVDAEPRLSQPVFTWTAVPAIAFYDGALGPGGGSFYALSFITLRGLSILRATGMTKLLNFSSNFGSLVLFIIAGKPIWLIGLVMAAGSIVGARIGSRLAIKNGAKLIRPVLVLACSGMAIRLLADPAHPIWTWF
jgi:uncharacterized membrane protein YfcA